jgi:hypothetical protein
MVLVMNAWAYGAARSIQLGTRNGGGVPNVLAIAEMNVPQRTGSSSQTL